MGVLTWSSNVAATTSAADLAAPGGQEGDSWIPGAPFHVKQSFLLRLPRRRLARTAGIHCRVCSSAMTPSGRGVHAVPSPSSRQIVAPTPAPIAGRLIYCAATASRGCNRDTQGRRGRCRGSCAHTRVSRWMQATRYRANLWTPLPHPRSVGEAVSGGSCVSVQACDCTPGFPTFDPRGAVGSTAECRDGRTRRAVLPPVEAAGELRAAASYGPANGSPKRRAKLRQRIHATSATTRLESEASATSRQAQRTAELPAAGLSARSLGSRARALEAGLRRRSRRARSSP